MAGEYLGQKIDQPPLVEEQQKDVNRNERGHYQQARHRRERAPQQRGSAVARLAHPALQLLVAEAEVALQPLVHLSSGLGKLGFEQGHLAGELRCFQVDEIQQPQQRGHPQHHCECDGQQLGHPVAQQPLLHRVQHDGENGRKKEWENDFAGNVQREHGQGQAQQHQRRFHVERKLQLAGVVVRFGHKQ